MALPFRNGVLLQWEGDGTDKRYRVRCKNVASSDERLFVSTGRTLFLDRTALDVNGYDFIATMEAICGDGGKTQRSKPIRFGFAPAASPEIAIALDFKVRLPLIVRP